MIRILLALTLLVTGTECLAQCGGLGKKSEATNAGTEFLLCFQENAVSGPGDDKGYLEIYIAALDDSATVTISMRAFPSRTVEYRLAARQTIFHREPDDMRILGSERVDDRVIRVKSTKPIICYGMNHKKFTADAFLALPRHTLSTEYRVMTYYNTTGVGPGDETAAQFVVAAFEDNTVVKITPTATTLLGQPAGSLLEWRLDSGQCVQIQGDKEIRGEDMTGSRISSNKPVAVYAGHVCAEVPLGSDIHGPAQSCDHLTESMPPVGVWGQTFVTTNFVSRNLTDRIRVLALNDGTTVKILDAVWTLNAGEFRDTLLRRPVTVEASAPVLVGTFARTAASSNQSDGDPFFAIVPPLDQSYTEFPFFASADSGYVGNYVIVVTERSGKDKITLDGTALPSSFFLDVPGMLNGKEYALATVEVQPGPHLIRTSATAENGINILAYGFGSFDSYGYTAGALLKPLRGVIKDHDQPPTIAARRGEEISVRNIVNERVYFDSAVVRTTDGTVMRIKEDLASRFGILEVDQSLIFHLDNESGRHVSGEILLYTHTADWMDLLPTQIPFSTGMAVANVEVSNSGSLAVWPNPATDRVTVSSGDAHWKHLTIVDDLGVVRQRITSFSNLSDDVELPVESLSAGHYTIIAETTAGTTRTTLLKQ